MYPHSQSASQSLTPRRAVHAVSLCDKEHEETGFGKDYHVMLMNTNAENPSPGSTQNSGNTVCPAPGLTSTLPLS